MFLGKNILWVNFISVLFCSVLNNYYWKVFSWKAHHTRLKVTFLLQYILVLRKLSGHGQNAPKVLANISHKWLLPQLPIEPLVPSDTSQARLSPSLTPVLLPSGICAVTHYALLTQFNSFVFFFLVQSSTVFCILRNKMKNRNKQQTSKKHSQVLNNNNNNKKPTPGPTSVLVTFLLLS